MKKSQISYLRNKKFSVETETTGFFGIKFPVETSVFYLFFMTALLTKFCLMMMADFDIVRCEIEKKISFNFFMLLPSEMIQEKKLSI